MLCNVTGTERYYNAQESACLECEGNVMAPLLMGIGVAVAAVVLIKLWVRFKPHRNVPALAKLADRIARAFTQLSLRAKLKQMLSFYQVATRVGTVCTCRARTPPQTSPGATP